MASISPLSFFSTSSLLAEHSSLELSPEAVLGEETALSVGAEVIARVHGLQPSLMMSISSAIGCEDVHKGWLSIEAFGNELTKLGKKAETSSSSPDLRLRAIFTKELRVLRAIHTAYREVPPSRLTLGRLLDSACEEGIAEVVKPLLFLGKKRDVASRLTTSTALRYAVKGENEDVVDLVLDYIRQDRNSIEHQMFEYRASEGIHSSDRNLFLARQFQSASFESFKSGRLDLLERIWQGIPEDIKFEPEKLRRYLNFACEGGQSTAIQYLIARGVDIHSESAFAKAEGPVVAGDPVFFACSYAKVEAVQTLLDAGASKAGIGRAFRESVEALAAVREDARDDDPVAMGHLATIRATAGFATEAPGLRSAIIPACATLPDASRTRVFEVINDAIRNSAFQRRRAALIGWTYLS